MRSRTLSSVASLIARAWPGVRSGSKITTSAPSCIARSRISSSLPRPTRNFGSASGRRWTSTSSTLTPAVRHSSRSSAMRASASLRAAELDVDEQRAILAGVGRGDAARARRTRASSRAISSTKFVPRRGRRLGRQLAPRPIAGAVGDQVADVQLARPARGVDGDRRDRVEPEQREVGEIVARQRLAAQVRVDEAQAAEPALRRRACGRRRAARSSTRRRR